MGRELGPSKQIYIKRSEILLVLAQYVGKEIVKEKAIITTQMNKKY
jgi:hypothetical protein